MLRKTMRTEDIKCPKCERVMVSIQACHMICTNCGAHRLF
ncbi:MAG: hypothetical protein YK1309IOTA_1140024 [Marine Group I thaumarchaeote]|nr:MAG: hypothetical protein YK1309IOTA_1140024 [Marine Group I thaumarchaeote]